MAAHLSEGRWAKLWTQSTQQTFWRQCWWWCWCWWWWKRCFKRTPQLKNLRLENHLKSWRSPIKVDDGMNEEMDAEDGEVEMVKLTWIWWWGWRWVRWEIGFLREAVRRETLVWKKPFVRRTRTSYDREKFGATTMMMMVLVKKRMMIMMKRRRRKRPMIWAKTGL